jgi:cytochrome c peroxidase
VSGGTRRGALRPGGAGVAAAAGAALFLSGAGCLGPATEAGTAPPGSTGSLPARPLGLDLYLPVPESNPLTPEKAALGERLFFDPKLSRDGTVACTSCHLPGHALSDTLAVSRGVDGRVGVRNAPTLMNRGWARSLFWDGRAASLEEQALHPIRSPREMDLPLETLGPRLRENPDYVHAFRAAFPDEEDPVGPEGVARALASYVRTLQAGDAPFDRFRAGQRDASPDDARRGARLFFGRAGCAVCHAGPTFSDGRFHNTGISWGSADLGRYRVTGADEDRGRFRTPPLRELTRTAPYMHDGSVRTLEEVVDLYDRGGTPNPFLSHRLRPLDLTEQEKADLVAFLRALSADPPLSRVGERSP